MKNWLNSRRVKGGAVILGIILMWLLAVPAIAADIGGTDTSGGNGGVGGGPGQLGGSE